MPMVLSFLDRHIGDGYVIPKLADIVVHKDTSLIVQTGGMSFLLEGLLSYRWGRR